MQDYETWIGIVLFVALFCLALFWPARRDRTRQRILDQAMRDYDQRKPR